MTEVVKNNENLVDISLSLYGGLEGLMQLWQDNTSMTFTADLAPGDQLEYDPDVDHTQTSEVITAVKPPKAVQPVIVLNDQNLIDLAIQEYGGVEGLMQLWQENTDLKLHDVYMPGTQLQVNSSNITNQLNKRYLDKRGVQVQTGQELSEDLSDWILAFGIWNDDGIWIDTENWKDY